MLKQLIKIANKLDKRGLVKEADLLDYMIKKVAIRKSLEDYIDLYVKIETLWKDPTAPEGEKVSALDKMEKLKGKILKLYPDIDFEEELQAFRGKRPKGPTPRPEPDIRGVYEQYMREDDLIEKSIMWGSTSADEELRQRGYDPEEIRMEHYMLHGLPKHEEGPPENSWLYDNEQSWEEIHGEDNSIEDIAYYISGDSALMTIRPDDYGYTPSSKEIVFLKFKELFKDIVWNWDTRGQEDFNDIVQSEDTPGIFSKYQTEDGNELANHLREYLSKSKKEVELRINGLKKTIKRMSHSFEERKKERLLGRVKRMGEEIEKLNNIIPSYRVLHRFLNDIEQEIAGPFSRPYRALLKSKYNA